MEMLTVAQWFLVGSAAWIGYSIYGISRERRNQIELAELNYENQIRAIEAQKRADLEYQEEVNRSENWRLKKDVISATVDLESTYKLSIETMVKHKVSQKAIKELIAAYRADIRTTIATTDYESVYRKNPMKNLDKAVADLKSRGLID